MSATPSASTDANTDAGGDAQAAVARPKPPITRYVLIGVAVVALIGLVIAGVRYWTVGRYLVSTDNAYLKADNTIVAPKVAGYIGEVLVQDNQPVKAGQVLARIDDRDLRAALDQALANEQAAEADVENLSAQITAQGSAIRQADAAASGAAASLSLANRTDQRRQRMAATGYGSTEQADAAATDTREKRASVEQLRAAATGARQQVSVLESQKALAIARLAHARAARRQAELNLSYATLVAPVDGTVGARSVRVGQYVQPGNQLMAVVPLQSVYVIANFKETQLKSVMPGQAATLHVDAFPDAEIRAQVDTLAPASGMEFSLLPTDNATGNFTKIVQRVPVKLVFPQGPLMGRLRPGMSVTATIDTRSKPAGRAVAAQVN